MARMNTPLDPFHCHGCGVRLGWTSRGEAKRMNVRAHVFCDNCKDKPNALTPRMEDVLRALEAQRAAGETPTLTAAADMIGVSRTRVQQIANAIRLRGEGDRLDRALGYEDEATTLPADQARHVVTAPVTSPPVAPVVKAPPLVDPMARGDVFDFVVD